LAQKSAFATRRCCSRAVSLFTTGD
jgi:hypothetical protein